MSQQSITSNPSEETRIAIHEERLANYPQWVHDIFAETASLRGQVSEHPVLRSMYDGSIAEQRHRATIIGYWSLVERFPHFMAMNLLKTRHGRDRGINMARAWLAKNLRVEQKHADMYVKWAQGFDIAECD